MPEVGPVATVMNSLARSASVRRVTEEESELPVEAAALVAAEEAVLVLVAVLVEEVLLLLPQLTRDRLMQAASARAAIRFRDFILFNAPFLLDGLALSPQDSATHRRQVPKNLFLRSYFMYKL